MAEKYIKIHGKLIAVTEEVYYTYYHMDRQRRTQVEKERRRRIASYDALDTEDCLGVDLLADKESTAVEETAMIHILAEKLHCCIEQLPKPDQKLLYAIYFMELSEREFAKREGQHYMTIHDRKIRALKKLREMMDK